jgi:uncharacterized UPF0160 family protein
LNIITHDGTFHADEVFAISLLKMFLGSKVSVTRTRARHELDQALKNPQTYVIDVGREYMPKMKNFDHHQRAFNARWKDGTLFSSCGLVWHHLKQLNYFDGYSRAVVHAIEENLIKKIDKHDNGVKNWALVSMIAMCNRAENTPDDFNRALGVAHAYLENMFYQENANETNMAIFRRDLQEYDEGEIFISSIPVKNSPILSELSRNTNALVVVYKTVDEHGGTDKWYARALKKYNEDLEEPIAADAPEHIRGLSGDQLSKKADIKGGIFVHRSGFVCGAENKTAALLYAEVMLAQFHRDHAHL